MAGFHWVILLSMVAVASSCHNPLQSCSCNKGGKGGGDILTGKVGILPVPIPIGKIIGKVPIGKVPIRKVPIVIKGRGFIHLGIFLGGLSSIVRSAKDIITDVIKLKIITIFDVLHIIISLSRSCAIIINVFISGLGTLFGNLVIAIYKILVCVLGLPKIGGIIGSRDICRDDYGCKYGWKRYLGKYNNHIDVLKHYGVYNARAQCESLLRSWTKGGGIDKLDYSSRIVYERIYRLSDLVSRDYKSWCQEDFAEVYFSVTLILGVFANRCRSGLGIKFVDEIHGLFIGHFQSQNIDITSITIRVKKSLETVEASQWSGVFVDSKDSSQQDTNVRKNESDEEEKSETNTRRDDKNEKEVSSNTDARESENNEKESTNRQETKEDSKSDQQTGQKSETTSKDNSSDDNSSNSNRDESEGSKSGGKIINKYISKDQIEASSSKKASADNKSSSSANTNTETSSNNGENRSKSSSSIQTNQESSKVVSEEKKLKVTKEVSVEQVKDGIF